MKFDVGDKVKVVKIDLGVSFSKEELEREEKDFLGKVGKIKDVFEDTLYPYQVFFENGKDTSFNNNELEGIDKQMRIE